MKIKNRKISKNAVIGSKTVIDLPSVILDCSIGENCYIGPFVNIQDGAFIGNDTHISSHSFICGNVKIGNKVFIGHSVNFVNDKFTNGKVNRNKKLWLNISVGNKVLIGTGSTILVNKICDGAIIGAGSVVTKDILEPGIYFGNPARLYKKFKC